MERDVNAVLRTARSMLFVCLGNTCRSPAAEGFARYHARALFDQATFQGLRIESAGLSACFHGAQPESIRFVKEASGEDISNHRTRTISREDVESFDIIITMEVYMNERLFARFPGVEGLRNKLFTLREACMHGTRGGSLDIEDPYMQDDRTYQAIIDEIHACTRVLIEAWLAASTRGKDR